MPPPTNLQPSTTPAVAGHARVDKDGGRQSWPAADHTLVHFFSLLRHFFLVSLSSSIHLLWRFLNRVSAIEGLNPDLFPRICLPSARIHPLRPAKLGIWGDSGGGGGGTPFQVCQESRSHSPSFPVASVKLRAAYSWQSSLGVPALTDLIAAVVEHFCADIPDGGGGVYLGAPKLPDFMAGSMMVPPPQVLLCMPILYR
jgi:hypothetical protein